MFDIASYIGDDEVFTVPEPESELPSDIVSYVKAAFAPIRRLSNGAWQPKYGQGVWWEAMPDGYCAPLSDEPREEWWIPESNERVDHYFGNVLYGGGEYSAFLYDGFDQDGWPASFVLLLSHASWRSFVIKILEWHFDAGNRWDARTA